MGPHEQHHLAETSGTQATSSTLLTSSDSGVAPQPELAVDRLGASPNNRQRYRRAADLACTRGWQPLDWRSSGDSGRHGCRLEAFRHGRVAIAVHGISHADVRARRDRAEVRPRWDDQPQIVRVARDGKDEEPRCTG